jgi:hypothetical protein
VKFFINFFIFFCISCTGLYALDFFYEKKVKLIYIEKPSYIISCSNKNYDYIVGGSSRVHNNFNSNLFDSLTKLSGFNIGYGGSAMSQNYLTLYLFLKNGNTIKNYLQQIEDNFLMDPKVAFTYPFQDYFFMPYIGDDNVDECYNSNTPLIKFYIWKYLPFVKYSEFNNYYGLKKIVTPTKIDSDMLKFKGYVKLDTKHKEGFPATDYKAINKLVAVDESNIYYLNKMRDLCLKNNINFIIYSSPLHQKSYLAYKPENLHSALINYVTNNNVKYFNFMLDKAFQGDSLFYDETHLNAKGTDLFTSQLADSLKNSLKK